MFYLRLLGWGLAFQKSSFRPFRFPACPGDLTKNVRWFCGQASLRYNKIFPETQNGWSLKNGSGWFSLCLFFWGEFFDESYQSEFVNHHILVFFSNHLELSKSKSEGDGQIIFPPKRGLGFDGFMRLVVDIYLGPQKISIDGLRFFFRGYVSSREGRFQLNLWGNQAGWNWKLNLHNNT